MKTNEALRAMQNCKDLSVLVGFYQDENAPNQVRKRARFKIACIWRDYEKRCEAARKAAATRRANREKKAAEA